MLAYLPFLAALLAGGAVAPDVADVVPFEAAARAERDFDRRRAELGLIGSAPFYGLEDIDGARAAALRDFEARRDELGLIGSAPFYGMEQAAAPASGTEEVVAKTR